MNNVRVWVLIVELLEERFRAEPDKVELLFEKACLLTKLGRMIEARNTYLELLARQPSHVGALNNLGTLLYNTGFRSAARTAYTEAVSRHPSDPMGHVNLANLFLKDGEFELAREHYSTALQLTPNHREAHKGLSYVYAELGNEVEADFHRQLGFQGQSIVEFPYHGAVKPIRLLLLVSAVGGNTPTANFLDDRVFQTFVVFVEFCDSDTPLPPHEFVFNAISDADLAYPALEAAQVILERTSAPVINDPSDVLFTRRVDIAHRFSQVPGVITPRTAVLSRALLQSSDACTALMNQGFEFPILLRRPGFHTGRHFIRVNDALELVSAIDDLKGDDFLVLQYLNSQAADGSFRKYRVMMIQGKLYPLHLAISRDWKVHYFTSEMAAYSGYRAEEAVFLQDMSAVLGGRIMAALKRIQHELKLDYAGIDFGVNEDGDLLLFEVNATMVVNPPEPDERWDYRRQAIDQVFQAVRSMLISTANTNLG
ncbi:tetratricopeptide repeat protein [Alicyclobacillus fastidiosus]|uniref:Tetratricopeptide repeat protein n=1 Tax=Alicyclobacillus fastidiosus TaxID=392011 RepID=A0ABY6ZNG2_9BACL|nr:tetratricopeptide repeat protein [Alicyclobacillus fastidiosus]WAH43490.1 tetratricopeptide repeat protein [Alicyclobacillus fastidiosus]